MCMSFGDMGYAKAEREINEHETNNAAAVSSEIKPFTTKAPSHVIESLDLIANYLGVTRNALVLKLINQYLGQAFTEFSLGYNRPFSNPDKTDEQLVITDLEAMLKASKDEVSPQAEDYLKRLVIDHLMEG